MKLFVAFVALAGVSTSAAGRVPLVINTPYVESAKSYCPRLIFTLS